MTNVLLTLTVTPPARPAGAPPAIPADERGAVRGADPAAGFAALLAGVLAPVAPPTVQATDAETAAASASALQATGEGPGGDGEDGAEAAAPTRRAASITRANRDLAALDPEFRARFDRVVERMRAEHGHEVSVVETARDPARQSYLYEQGRTRPGPVVTWTLDSNHLSGRAADVIIDGSYGNPAAYARLGRIAEEEGLRTLGSRDPGHLELPRGTPGAWPERAATRLAAAPPGPAPALRPEAQPGPAVPQVAQIAQVAAVAKVATVAPLAPLAEVASPTSGESAPAPAQPTGPAAAMLAARGGAGLGADSGEGRRSSDEQAEPRAHALTDAAGSHRATAAELLAAAGAERTGAAAAEPAAARPVVLGGSELAARLAQVMAAQEPGEASRRVAQMVLRLDNPAGGEDTIRVGLRGAAVDARIELGGDAGAAERMHAHVGELRRALEQKGLETEALRVRAAATRPAAELVDAARIAAVTLDDAATRTATRSNADGSTPRERGHAAPDPEARRDSHTSRQRSRQNPQEGDLT